MVASRSPEKTIERDINKLVIFYTRTLQFEKKKIIKLERIWVFLILFKTKLTVHWFVAFV